MSEFKFNRGEDYTIAIDGKVLGGVTKAVFGTQNSFVDIKEFLTDIPVHRAVKADYTIELVMNNEFNCGVELGALRVTGNGKTVEYRDCHTDKIEEVINPSGKIEYRVRLIAETRNEYGN